MKKIVTLFSFVLLLSPLFAQTLLPRVGVTLSTGSYEPYAEFAEKSDKKLLTGFTVGVGYDLFINDRFSFQPEVNFIQKGLKIDDIAYPDGYEYKLATEYKLNYLEIPVLVKAKFGGATKFYVTAGPTVSIGLSGTYSLESSFAGMPEEPISSKVKFTKRPENYDGYDKFADNRVEAGVQVGGGVLLFGKVNIEARYGHSFTGLFEDTEFKNRVIQVSAGIPINLF